MKGKRIKYIGRHAFYTDRISKTKEVWKKNQVKIVPEEMVAMYLRYGDSFVDIEAEAEALHQKYFNGDDEFADTGDDTYVPPSEEEEQAAEAEAENDIEGQHEEKLEVVEPAKVDEVKEDAIEAAKFAIDQMSTKDDIVNFITNQWNIAVDFNKATTKLDEYRDLAKGYIDQYGLIENDA